MFKLTGDMYNALLKEYQGDKIVREEAKQIVIGKIRRDEPETEKPVEAPKKNTDFEKNEEILIKNAQSFTPSVEKPKVVETPKVEAPAPAPAAEALPVTTLAHEDGSPAWLASVDAAHGRVLVVPLPADVDAEGRVAELWLIPEGGAPASLGLLPHDRTRAVDVPADLHAALVAGATLAVSLEPPGGAPHGAPTGPVVASGALRI